jgi:DivIVA domain-containing protein
VASDQPRESAASASGEPPASPVQEETTERRNLAQEISDVSFTVSVRGYDRAAVDAYVSRVEQVVAELELERSPEAAVKRALEQVGEQTRGVLEQAGRTRPSPARDKRELRSARTRTPRRKTSSPALRPKQRQLSPRRERRLRRSSGDPRRKSLPYARRPRHDFASSAPTKRRFSKSAVGCSPTSVRSRPGSKKLRPRRMHDSRPPRAPSRLWT